MNESLGQEAAETVDALAADVKKDAPTLEAKVAALAEKAEVPTENLWHRIEAEIHHLLDNLLGHKSADDLKADINAAVPPAGAPSVGVLAPSTPKAPE